MNRLPALKGKEIIKALKKCGFVERRTTGSHSILKNKTNRRIVTIPVHGAKDIKRGTLFNIIKQAGLKVEEFIDLLE